MPGAVSDVLEVVHASAGRLRLRLPRAARIDGVTEAAAATDGVVTCSWNARTRSLLVLYRPETVAPSALIDMVAARTASSVPPVTSMPGAQGPATVAAAVAQVFGHANHAAARRTGGFMDLATLGSLALVTWAAAEVVRGRTTPLAWSSALWYAHGLYRDYNVRSRE